MYTTKFECHNLKPKMCRTCKLQSKPAEAVDSRLAALQAVWELGLAWLAATLLQRDCKTPKECHKGRAQ